MTLLDAQNEWDRAIGLFQGANYQEALQLFSQVDSSIDREEKIGYCQFNLGLWPAAKKTYLGILKADSTHIASHLYLGNIYDQEFDLPKSIKHYHALTVLDKKNPSYFKLTARAYKKAHLPRLAFKYFADALSLNDKDLSVLLDMADIYLSNQEWLEADSLIDQATVLDSSNIKVLLASAHCAYGQKKYAEVTSTLEKTYGRLDLTPFYSKMLGYAYLQIDSLDQAIHVLSNLLHKEESEYTYSYLGKAHLQKKEFEKSAFYYEKAIVAGLSDNLGQYHATLAKLKKEEGEWSAAISHYESAFDFSGNPVYLFHKGQVCEQYYRDKQMAVNQYNRFLSLSKEEDQYQTYAKERIRILKEYIHQSSR